MNENAMLLRARRKGGGGGNALGKPDMLLRWKYPCNIFPDERNVKKMKTKASEKSVDLYFRYCFKQQQKNHYNFPIESVDLINPH